MEMKICIGVHIHTHARWAVWRSGACARIRLHGGRWCYIEDVISSFPLLFLFLLAMFSSFRLEIRGGEEI